MTGRTYRTYDGRVFPYSPDEDATGYIARYFCFLTVQERECDSVAEALRFLIHGEDRGDLSSEGIYAPDGTQVMDKNAIQEAWGEWDYAADAPILEGTAVEVTNQRMIEGG